MGLLTKGKTLLAVDKASRDARRKAQAEGAQRLISSGVMDDLFAKIDAGEIELDGADGLIQQLIKTGLERGLQAELSEHVGYEKGDPEAYLYENSRNGSLPKTVGTSVGDVELGREERTGDGIAVPASINACLVEMRYSVTATGNTTGGSGRSGSAENIAAAVVSPVTSTAAPCRRPNGSVTPPSRGG